MLEITLLGTAALLPLPDRALSCACVRYAGHRILLDCGEGTQSAARRAGVSVVNTDVIALTHYHGDHIFGLPGLLQTMNSMGRTQPLVIVGPAGLEEAMAPILMLTGDTAFPIRLQTVPAEGLAMHELGQGWPEDIRLHAFATEHRVASQGYCIEMRRAGRFLPDKAKQLGVPVRLWGLLQRGQAVWLDERQITPDMVLGPQRRGLRVVFSGDTSACEMLTKAACGADLLICDGTYGENEQAEHAIGYGHMTFAQAARTAADARVKRLWLTHFSQMLREPESCLPNAQAVFPDAECGFDGKQINLCFDNED